MIRLRASRASKVGIQGDHIKCEGNYFASGLIARMAGSSQRVMVHCKMLPKTKAVRFSGLVRPACHTEP